ATNRGAIRSASTERERAAAGAPVPTTWEVVPRRRPSPNLAPWSRATHGLQGRPDLSLRDLDDVADLEAILGVGNPDALVGATAPDDDARFEHVIVPRSPPCSRQPLDEHDPHRSEVGCLATD